MVQEKPELRRIFIAVNIPPELRGRIHSELSSAIPAKGCKVVKAENLHLTMRFMGYMSDEALGELVEKLRVVGQMRGFEVELSGVGQFKGRVLWLGVGRGKEELEGIAKGMDAALGSKERFSAHLTLARNKDLHKAEFDAVLRELGKKVFSGVFRAGSVDVMESKLTPKGPEYSVVERIDLD